jgi:hypothetical protein
MFGVTDLKRAFGQHVADGLNQLTFIFIQVIAETAIDDKLRLRLGEALDHRRKQERTRFRSSDLAELSKMIFAEPTPVRDCFPCVRLPRDVILEHRQHLKFGTIYQAAEGTKK